MLQSQVAALIYDVLDFFPLSTAYFFVLLAHIEESCLLLLVRDELVGCFEVYWRDSVLENLVCVFWLVIVIVFGLITSNLVWRVDNQGVIIWIPKRINAVHLVFIKQFYVVIINVNWSSYSHIRFFYLWIYNFFICTGTFCLLTILRINPEISRTIPTSCSITSFWTLSTPDIFRPDYQSTLRIRLCKAIVFLIQIIFLISDVELSIFLGLSLEITALMIREHPEVSLTNDWFTFR